MSAIATWLLQNAVIATLAAVVLGAALTRWRMPARLEHALWLALAVKFLLPPLVEIPLPERLVFGAPAVERAEGAAAPSQLGGPGEALSTGVIGATEAMVATEGVSTTETIGATTAASSPAAAWHSIGAVLLLLWFAGALFAFGWHVVRMAVWHRRRGHVAPPSELKRLVDEVAAALAMRAPRVELDAALQAPVVSGLLRPRLIWPVALVGTMSASVARTVIAHELSHIRRGDLWVGVLELVGRSVWWWFPGWSFVERRLRDAAERACDDAVIRLYPALRRRYAEGLLDVAGIAATRRPAVAIGLDGPGSMRRRLRAVLSPAPPSRGRSGVLALVVLSLGLLPAWSVQNARASDVPDAQEREAPADAPDTADALLSALRDAAADADPDVRRAAANALREVDAPESVATLRTLAADADEYVRFAARVALGLEAARPNLVFPADPAPARVSDESFAALTRNLSQGTAAERLDAAARFGNLRDARAVPALRAGLRDPDFRVRQYSASALAAIGPEAAAAVTALLRLIEDPHPRVRQSVASALGHHDEPRVIAALAGALADDDAAVRQVAVGALGRIAAGRAR